MDIALPPPDAKGKPAAVVVDDTNGLDEAEVKELVRRVREGDYAALDWLAKCYTTLKELWDITRHPDLRRF